MKTLFTILLLAAPIFGGQIDRIVAVVNNHPVSESEWEQQERFEALGNNVPFKGFQRSKEALDRIIDRRIVLAQRDNLDLPEADPKKVAAQLVSFRKQLGLESDSAWKQRLKDYGLLEADVAEIIGEQLDVLEFVDTRFRMAVQVSPLDIRTYYNETYLPEFRKQTPDTPAPALDQVRAQIESILLQQRMNDLFNTWMKTVRSQATIRFIHPEWKP